MNSTKSSRKRTTVAATRTMYALALPAFGHTRYKIGGFDEEWASYLHKWESSRCPFSFFFSEYLFSGNMVCAVALEVLVLNIWGCWEVSASCHYSTVSRSDN
uniref:Uncharacterized protein n=1 Tax=Arundo donax TaxID=35708 RepID=A0A0A8XQW8_ARUDO